SLTKPELSSGDEIFDLWYITNGSSEGLMRNFLKEDVRQHLMETDRRKIVGSIEIATNRFAYTNHDLPISTDEYNDLIGTTIFLCDRLKQLNQDTESA
ncbi:MAG: hypothetical protein V3T35_01730, partial [Spirochaetia bacterium]